MCRRRLSPRRSSCCTMGHRNYPSKEFWVTLPLATSCSPRWSLSARCQLWATGGRSRKEFGAFWEEEMGLLQRLGFLLTAVVKNGILSFPFGMEWYSLACPSPMYLAPIPKYFLVRGRRRRFLTTTSREKKETLGPLPPSSSAIGPLRAFLSFPHCPSAFPRLASPTQCGQSERGFIPQ